MYNYKNIKNNQVIGYSQEKIINGVTYVYEYAIKKQANIFKTYFFCVEKKHIDNFDENAQEEILKFNTIEDALFHIKKKGANENLLKPMKGVSFF